MQRRLPRAAGSWVASLPNHFARTNCAAWSQDPVLRRLADRIRASLLLLLRFFNLRPGIAQGDRPAEDRQARCRILVHTEIAQALELEATASRRGSQARLQLAAA